MACSRVLGMLWAEFWPIVNRWDAEMERDALRGKDAKAKSADFEKWFDGDANKWLH